MKTETKNSQMDVMWKMFGNPNINDTKSHALEDKYWEGRN